MKYTIETQDELGRETVVGTNLTESDATQKAHQLSEELSGAYRVYVHWYRETDSQHGYLNRDGHNPIGKAW